MQVIARMFLCLVFLFGCAKPKNLSEKKLSHHTEKGFANNYLPKSVKNKSLSDVLRWRTTRKPQELIEFEQIGPDLPFLQANRTESTLTWIGHSTFLWQHQGVNLITDPHLTNRASPVGFAGPKRVVPPAISLQDLPLIDIVVISHNHYDHLDRKSVLGIVNRQKKSPPVFLVPLGMQAWFEKIGIEKGVIELDWWDSHEVGAWQLHAVPVQHWSRRGLRDVNRVLWSGWVIESPGKKLFFAGDTGYSQDFLDIGRKFGRMDLSLIPIGAYAPRWFMKDMHCTPEEAVQIHLDVSSQLSVGMHWGTFLDLTDEPLDEPPERLRRAVEAKHLDPQCFITMKHGETLRGI
jgi:N-acyl-phosphatidylethanolamine-hydrolysing phospholipase D